MLANRLSGQCTRCELWLTFVSHCHVGKSMESHKMSQHGCLYLSSGIVLDDQIFFCSVTSEGQDKIFDRCFCVTECESNHIGGAAEWHLIALWYLSSIWQPSAVSGYATSCFYAPALQHVGHTSLLDRASPSHDDCWEENAGKEKGQRSPDTLDFQHLSGVMLSPVSLCHFTNDSLSRAARKSVQWMLEDLSIQPELEPPQKPL